jgi:hypothetical protein
MVATLAHSNHWLLGKQGANMLKASGLILLLALAACSTQGYTSSPCNSMPGGAECQIDRYMRAGN